MVMNNIIKTLSLVSIIFLLTGCPPYSKSDNQDNTSPVNNLEAQLSKTSTGSESLSYLNQLRSAGYNVQFLLASTAEIDSLNGHGGGGFERNGSGIKIFINNGLNETDQAHVVAHELVHIKDDLEIDQFLKTRSYIDSAAQDFIANHQSQGTNNFDSNVVNYVLSTLFCAEIRAYTKNQTLNDQGLRSNLFTKGSQLPQFVDQNYIYQFNVSYGSSATSMKNWCLSYSSMSAIQNQLAW